ncbi:MAG: YceI family protein [Acidimicrobiales bacterium]
MSTRIPATAPAADGATLPAGAWDIDPHHSHVEFVTRHLLSRVRGRFTDFDGAVVVDPDPARSSVEVSIRAASISTHHDDRDAHLRGPDFLDVDRYPELTSRSTAVSPLDPDGRFRVEGDLTIRDVTRRMVLDTDFLGWSADPWGGTRAAFSARAEIDRDDFGAGWDIILDTGGLLVGKKVQLELEVEAIRRVPS